MRRLVIGIGNPFRRDDGAGIEAARLLRARGVPGMEVLEHDGEPASLLDAWEGADEVVLIDAVRSEGPPGTVHVLPDAATTSPASSFSSHGIGVGEAVGLARALGRLPARLTLIGIVGGDLEMGEGLSAPVRAAVERTVEDLASEGVPRPCA